MKISRMLLLLFLAVLIPMALITGCHDDDDDDANVRVIHMSYDAPAVDVRFDNQIEIANLGYPESSGYVDVDEDRKTLTVVPNGETAPVVLQTDVDLEEDRDYTVVVLDQLDAIDALFIQDDRDAPGDRARVRFIHTSPDAPAVDIRTGSGAGDPIFQNVAFKQVTDYVDVPGGDYVLAVTPANATLEVVRFNPLTLENNQTYTIVAHGTLNDIDDVPFAVRAFTDSGDGAAFEDLTDSRVMAIHASPDAPGVDLFVDGQRAAENLAFSENTGYIGVNSGTRNIRVNPAGSQDAVIDADVDIESGGVYSVFAADEVANITPVILEDDLTAPTAGMAHVRFVHLSPDAPPVDVAANGAVLFSNVAFGEASDSGMFTPVTADTYDLEVRLAGTQTSVLTVEDVTLEDGAIYTIVAEGYAAPASGQPALSAEIIENRAGASADSETPPDTETTDDTDAPSDMDTAGDDIPGDTDPSDIGPAGPEPPSDMQVTAG